MFSPLRRGWSGVWEVFKSLWDVLPAQAGMVRFVSACGCSKIGSPRSGGDGPRMGYGDEYLDAFSPLRRGWSCGNTSARLSSDVLPAQAGMVRMELIPEESVSTFSPLRRGWSGGGVDGSAIGLVLPAQAGMVLSPALTRLASACSPRSGGDGPATVSDLGRAVPFSPLRRGWSGRLRAPPRRQQVLPAQAGMVPLRDPTPQGR